MEINWTVLTPIVVGTITALIGIAIDRIFERKAKLISYFGHRSSFKLSQPPNITINLHSVVIKNVGRKPAIDTTLAHIVLPDNFEIYPPTKHSINTFPNAGSEIVIPRLVPGEQITVSYLYFPPITYAQINDGIKHSEGFAKATNVLPTPQPAKWIVRVGGSLMIVGIIVVIYGVIELIRVIPWNNLHF